MKLPCYFSIDAKALTITLLILLLNGCKKEKNITPEKPFQRYEGSWKPDYLYDWNGLKSAPFPSGINYSLYKDSIIYTEMEVISDSTGTRSIVKVCDTLDFDYKVTSTVDDNALFQLTEKYTIYTKSGQVFRQLTYNNQATLTEGRINYGLTNNSQNITSDSIRLFFYNWSGVYAWISERHLKKM